MDPVIAATLIFLSIQYVGLGIIIYFLMRCHKEDLHDDSVPMITAIFWPILVTIGTALTMGDFISGRKKIKW